MLFGCYHKCPRSTLHVMQKYLISECTKHTSSPPFFSSLRNSIVNIRIKSPKKKRRESNTKCQTFFRDLWLKPNISSFFHCDADNEKKGKIIYQVSTIYFQIYKSPLKCHLIFFILLLIKSFIFQEYFKIRGYILEQQRCYMRKVYFCFHF